MELLLWFSVDGETMVGGVDDSYPELAAGDGCDPGLVDSWTCSKEKRAVRIVLHAIVSSSRRHCVNTGHKKGHQEKLNVFV